MKVKLWGAFWAIGFLFVGPSPAGAVSFQTEAIVVGTALDAQYNENFETLFDDLTGGDFSITTIGRGFGGQFGSERRSILEFDIAAIPASSPVLSANLSLNFVSGPTE